MIWNAAALSLLLASADAAVKAPTKKEIKKDLKLMQELSGAALVKKLKTPKRSRLLPSSAERELYSNSEFLNFQYFSDGNCAAAPYANGGYGMGVCMPVSPTGGIRMTGCTTSGADIDVTYEQYDNPECSGSPTITVVAEVDETCQANDAPDIELEGIVTSFLYSNQQLLSLEDSYVTLTCDSSIKEPSWYMQSSYEDAQCENLVTYFGYNDGGCVPFFFSPDDDGAADDGFFRYTTLDGCGSDDSVVTADNLCAGNDLSGDDDTDDGDDGDDDDGDDGDDDGGASGGCYPFFFLDDDTTKPGEYFSFEDTCASDDDDDVCFAGSETVQLDSGVKKALADVEVGDIVQVVGADGNLKFSEVVFLPHTANTDKAVFTELQFASGNSLRATPAHLVLAGVCGADAFELTAMKYVKEGGCVQTESGEDKVMGSELVVDHGVYTLVTKESTGLVVVNGVRASSFAHNHWLVNQYYNIHRTVYEFAPSLLKNRDVVAANLIVGDIAMSL